jgi:hypothetical protein
MAPTDRKLWLSAAIRTVAAVGSLAVAGASLSLLRSVPAGPGVCSRSTTLHTGVLTGQACSVALRHTLREAFTELGTHLGDTTLLQSASVAQVCPEEHVVQAEDEPPQSISASSPSRTPLKHEAGALASSDEAHRMPHAGAVQPHTGHWESDTPDDRSEQFPLPEHAAAPRVAHVGREGAAIT